MVVCRSSAIEFFCNISQNSETDFIKESFFLLNLYTSVEILRTTIFKSISRQFLQQYLRDFSHIYSVNIYEAFKTFFRHCNLKLNFVADIFLEKHLKIIRSVVWQNISGYSFTNIGIIWNKDSRMDQKEFLEDSL